MEACCTCALFSFNPTEIILGSFLFFISLPHPELCPVQLSAFQGLPNRYTVQLQHTTMAIESSEMLRMHSTLLPAAAVTGAALAALYALYRSLLPKPLPDIPYNKESANRFFGDIPDMAAAEKAGGRRNVWFAKLAQKHGSPIAQFFFGMGTKPGIVVADYREARDLLLRRGKELVRGHMNLDPWLGLIPGHFIAMEDDNPRIKGSRSLGKDLMGTGFLHSVSVAFHVCT